MVPSFRTVVDFGTHLLEVGAEVIQHMGSDTLALEEHAEQQVLRAEVGIAHPPRFAEREVDDFLDARRGDDVLDNLRSFRL